MYICIYIHIYISQRRELGIGISMYKEKVDTIIVTR